MGASDKVLLSEAAASATCHSLDLCATIWLLELTSTPDDSRVIRNPFDPSAVEFVPRRN
jgi:hypothetical protein